MNLITIEKLRTFNKSISKQELIDKYYTKKEKDKLKIFKYAIILLLLTFIVIFITMFTWDPFNQLYKHHELITPLTIFAIYLSLTFLTGRLLSNARKKCDMAVLTRIFYKQFYELKFNNIAEGLDIIRYHEFELFCKHETINITKEILSLIKEQLIEDQKVNDVDNFSLAKGWFKTTIIPLVTSLVSVLFAINIQISLFFPIYFLIFIIILLIGFILSIINIRQNDSRVNQMNKYQDFLKIINIAHLEIVKEKHIIMPYN